MNRRHGTTNGDNRRGHLIVTAAGVSMPRLVYGTAWKKAQTAALVGQALTLGFRGIDTACQPKHYHEPGVGEALAAQLAAGLRRADLYLQSKFTPVSGQDPNNIPYDPKAPLAQQVAQSFAASVRNLQTDYLDCLVLHSPLADSAQWLTVWGAMESLVDTGGVRQLGISNCYDVRRLAYLQQTARIKPMVVQNRFYAASGYDHGIREFCRDHALHYQSFWTLTANPQLLGSAAILAAVSKHGRTPAQVLFRYLTQIGITPLTGTKSAQHMREDLDIFNFELSDTECVSIGALCQLMALSREASAGEAPMVT
jgi:diketogulonate reductase-like aldo/keto reductase